MSPAEVTEVIDRAWEAWLEKDRRTATPHATVWASSWRACERRMVYDMTQPDMSLPVTADVLAKFKRGNDREHTLLTDLGWIGREIARPPFVIENQQKRFELKGRGQAGIVITGKVDGFLRFTDEKVGVPLEIKSWHPNVVDRIETFDDVFTSVWTRAGGYQLLAYLYDSGAPYGFMLLDRSGLPRLLLVEMTDEHWHRMEDFLSRAERAVAHARAGTLPDYIDDPGECHRCPFFGTACQPPLSAKVTDVILDADLEDALERWWALRDQGKQWRELDEQVKKKLRGVESAVAGHFSISGKWGTQSRVVLPPDIKKQFTVADPKGRFSLEIERL